MRKARNLVPGGKEGVYHVASRLVDCEMVFEEEEKRKLVDLMKAYAGFCGVSLVSWCVMGNHFHLLVFVPEKTGDDVPEAVALKRIAMISGSREMAEFLKMLGECRTADDRREMLRPYTRRMGDLGLFMKTVKQRYTRWFNNARQRNGALWDDRYRSTIVESPEIPKIQATRHARTVATYMDLGPVFCGLAANPEDYPWSGYGSACRGDQDALRGLRGLWGKSAARSLAAHTAFLRKTLVSGVPAHIRYHGKSESRWAKADLARVGRARRGAVPEVATARPTPQLAGNPEKPGPKRITPEQKLEILRLLDEGNSGGPIARKFGITRQALTTYRAGNVNHKRLTEKESAQLARIIATTDPMDHEVLADDHSIISGWSARSVHVLAEHLFKRSLFKHSLLHLCRENQ